MDDNAQDQDQHQHQEHGSEAAAAGYRIDIGRDATGPVIAGHHNVVVDAHHGSTVTLLMEPQRPRPVRREHIGLPPRRRPAPLGRESELATLAEALRGGEPVELWGPPGIGKSTLLRHAALTLEPGPDGVVFLSATHREAGDLAQEIFEACYEAAGYAPSGPELRRLMAGLRVTVYIDNAELTTEELRDLMDAVPDASFVFAGRERALPGESVALELAGLDRGAGVQLLSREAGIPTPASDGPAGELWKASAGHPLLLVRAAALTRRDGTGAGVLPAPGALADLVPLLLGQLDPDALGGLRLLATLSDAELAPVHVGALAGVPDPAGVCGRLAALGLAEATERGYRCTADAARVLRERHPVGFPVERLCDYFARWATRRTTRPEQIADHARALEIAAELAERAGRPDLAVSVAWAASPGLVRSLRFGSWGRVLHRGRIAARQSGDQQALAYFTHEEGIRKLLTGRRVLAGVLLGEAAVLWRQLGDTAGVQAAQGAQQYAPAQPSPPDPTLPAGDGGSGSAAATDAPHLPADGGTAYVPQDASASAATSTTPTSGPDAPGQLTAPPTSASTPTPTAPDHHGDVSPMSVDPGAGSGTAAGAGPDPAAALPTPTAQATAPPASAPPGADQLGSVGLSAGGGQGGAALTGAVAATAPGASAVTTFFVVVAVAVGFVIAAMAVTERSEPDGPSGAAGLSRSASPTRLPVIPVPSTTRTREPARPSPTPTALAGRWRTDRGGTAEFEQKSPGVYTLGIQVSKCGVQYTMEFTGSSGRYRSHDERFYDQECRLVGHVTSEISVSSGGSRALWTRTYPQVPGQECLTCDTTMSLTRIP
ncbi:ATP-binding protein [Streptomyces sp. BR123]|uniref:ATP-binding protein n=1 Tax=Streptomyces sp. BR123 TaxID=2749828 RepID=UPI0015C433EF|nr:ATP-binding protein [Streptomyces sp. BR123]NXY97533.1 ATP-binding protein [Streptomyces sp. BR123]